MQPIYTTSATVYSTLYRWDEDEEKPHKHEKIKTTEKSTLGYFIKPNSAQKTTPDLNSEERKKLGLIYYKPITQKLVELLQNQPKKVLETRNVPKTSENPLAQIQTEIQQDLNELDTIAETYDTSSTRLQNTYQITHKDTFDTFQNTFEVSENTHETPKG